MTFVIDGFPCVEINHQTYEKLKKDPLAWYCADCTTEIPFSTLSNKDFKDFFIQQPLHNLCKSYKNRAKKLKK